MDSVISARITITFDELFLNMFVEFEKLEKLDASQMKFLCHSSPNELHLNSQ